MAKMTNRQYFVVCCDKDKLPQINRYVQRALEKRISPSAPIWDKEAEYEKFLEEEIDIRKFEAAKLDKYGHALPENYYYEHRM